MLFSGGVYGLAWLLSRARLTRGMREFAKRIPFVGELLNCIVCTGVWVAIGIVLVMRWSNLFSPSLRELHPADGVVLVGLAVTTTWIVGRALGDAKA